MIGKKNDYSWLWAFLILFSAVLNIAVQASAIIPVSKVQLLRQADSEIKLHKRNGWKPGKPEERAFSLHLLGRRENTRVKRYDRNAWKNWKPGDPDFLPSTLTDPWAKTQADYERQYNAEQGSKRRQKEANRRHREEVARNKAWQKEVEERRIIIGVSCFLGIVVCCGCLGAFCKCKDDRCSGSRTYVPSQNEEINYRSGAGIHQLQGTTTTTNASSTQRGSSLTTREEASPPSHVTAPLLLPEKPPSAPPSDENGPELPPSYATAMADSS